MLAAPVADVPGTALVAMPEDYQPAAVHCRFDQLALLGQSLVGELRVRWNVG